MSRSPTGELLVESPSRVAEDRYLLFKKELHQHLAGMPVTQQRQVLDYARTLSTRQIGTKGGELLSFAGTIPLDDLAQMKAAIEEDCETIDVHGW